MLYFVKRNHRLQEFKAFYKELQSLCFYLDRLTPELEKAKSVLLNEQLSRYLESLIEGISLERFLTDYSEAIETKQSIEVLNKISEKPIEFKKDDFIKLNLKIRHSFVILKNYVLSFKKVISDLKNYESFQGRIRFGQFATLFNFEDYIYDDKQFQYSIISNYNKRIIPEFISAAFANMVYENFVGDEIRRNMEQYFIAIMSNMDYHNFAHIGQMKKELKSVLNKEKNLIYIIGAAPHTFNDTEYVELLNERIEKANSLVQDNLEFISPNPMWKKSLNSIYSRKIKESELYYAEDKKHSVLGAKKVDGKNKTSKLTSENLDYIYTDITDRNLSNYNLFIVTSTFHILKTAIEIERYFYNNDNYKPDNIIFVGNEKFFDLAHNKNNCQDTPNSKYHKKKIKSFLYELFMYTLDKNAIK